MNYRTLLYIGTLLVSQALHAHDDAYFDTHPTPNGGQMRMAGPFHLELLMGEESMTVYVTDHAGTPVSPKTLQAEAILLSGQVKQRIRLKADAGLKTLRGRFPSVKLRPDTLVILMVETDDKRLHLARFRPGPKAPESNPESTAR